MADYRVLGVFSIEMTQTGKSPVDARSAGREMARILGPAVTQLLAADADLRERLWRAADGGDDRSGTMTFKVSSLDET